jgi:tetratricopeptide (TPR) repeat protein
MSPKLLKIVFTVTGLFLFVLLFIAPKTGEGVKSPAEPEKKQVAAIPDANANVEMYLKMASGALDISLKGNYEAYIKKSAANKNFLDSLVKFWDRLKRPDLASYFTEKKALELNTADSWFSAGNRYYYSIQFTRDETEKPVLYQSAIRSFKNGLKLEPGNNDAKIMLATCYVEGTPQPMEGISLLKEVEKNDSNNVKLQLSFAFFSVKSGQMDKAISRFNKVLQIDPTYIETYLHLADIYEQMNNVDKTIEVLEQYAAKTNDPTAKIEIEKYIKQLKTK